VCIFEFKTLPCLMMLLRMNIYLDSFGVMLITTTLDFLKKLKLNALHIFLLF